MKLNFMVALCGTITLLSICNNSASRYRVHTQYHIHKVVYNGREQITENRTDTFYFTSNGKRYYNTNGTKIVEERKGNTVEWKTFDQSGKLINSNVYFLNEKHLVDSFATKEGTQVTYAHKYIYDSNGYMIEDRQYTPQPPAIYFKYTWFNGNKIEETMTNIPAVDTVQMPNATTGEMDTVITTYDNVILHKEYYLDKPNFPRNENFGYTNPDIKSKNLEKKAVQLSDKGDTIDIYWFRYQFDNKGRVTSATQFARSGHEYDSTYYTYY
jgi:hypothetical protein